MMAYYILCVTTQSSAVGGSISLFTYFAPAGFASLETQTLDHIYFHWPASRLLSKSSLL